MSQIAALSLEPTMQGLTCRLKETADFIINQDQTEWILENRTNLPLKVQSG